MPEYLSIPLFVGIFCIVLSVLMLIVGLKSRIGYLILFTEGSFILRKLPEVVKPEFIKPINYFLYVGLFLMIFSIFGSVWYFSFAS